MIRINLVPQSRKAVRAVAPSTPANVQAWAIGYTVAGLVWILALLGVYMSYDGQLDEERVQNAELTTQIGQHRSKSTRLEEVQALLAESQQLEQVVAELQRARTGPTRMIMELSQILSPAPGGGPTIDPEALEEMRRDNPLAGFNRSWDPRRLWLTSFEETDGICQMHGLGKTNEDVAEFLRRLALSELFATVTLTKTQSTEVQALSLTLINFELTCTVNY